MEIPSAHRCLHFFFCFLNFFLTTSSIKQVTDRRTIGKVVPHLQRAKFECLNERFPLPQSRAILSAHAEEFNYCPRPGTAVSFSIFLCHYHFILPSLYIDYNKHQKGDRMCPFSSEVSVSQGTRIQGVPLSVPTEKRPLTVCQCWPGQTALNQKSQKQK